MSRKTSSIVTLLLGLCIVTACASPQTATPEATAGLPNPASVFCEDHGGQVEMRQNDAGEYGVCIFPDGSECDEWAYFRGECQPKQTQDWATYTHPSLSFSFDYPADGTIETVQPERSISMTGPLQADEHWPVFFISYPDEEAYYPPAEADLIEWLADHNLLMGDRLPGRLIAGFNAIHLRQAGSPQAYAVDHYYLTHEGRIFQITILHAGKEDWQVYDRFLDSFKFN